MSEVGAKHCIGNQQTQRDLESEGGLRGFLRQLGYRLGGLIGEGAYCKVRAAERNGRQLAIKLISKQHATDEYVKQFLPRELAILKNLSHPNIATIHRILDIDNRVFIFMELAEKGDLLDYIKANNFISESEARYFFSQLAKAIQYIHSRQVSHRDLKCENVLITGNNVVKLTDFGFGRQCVDPETGQRILSDTYCGSMAYAAPEVIKGIPYNPKMYDIWSLGCILFIMVTGTMPFDESNLRRMLRNMNEKRIHYPSALDGRISDECKRLISRMIEPDVIKRTTIGKVMRSSWLQRAVA